MPDQKKSNNHTIHYGFVSTGNLNERTATHMATIAAYANRNIMADVNRLFNYLEKWKTEHRSLSPAKHLSHVLCFEKRL